MSSSYELTVASDCSSSFLLLPPHFTNSSSSGSSTTGLVSVIQISLLNQHELPVTLRGMKLLLHILCYRDAPLLLITYQIFLRVKIKINKPQSFRKSPMLLLPHASIQTNRSLWILFYAGSVLTCHGALRRNLDHHRRAKGILQFIWRTTSMKILRTQPNSGGTLPEGRTST